MSISSMVPDPEPAPDKEPEAPKADAGDQSVETDATTSISSPPAPTQGDEILAALLSKIKPPGIAEKINMMIVAPPGHGKTTLAGSAENNLILDTERSTSALAPGAKADIVKDNIQILPYRSWNTFDFIVQKLEDNVPELDWVDVFTVDTHTELHKKGLQEEVERHWNFLQRQWANAPSTKDESKSEYSAETEQQADNNEHIRRLTSRLRDLDRHVIINCHYRRIERKNRPDIIQPDFSEKLANTLMAMMDIVGFMTMDEEGNRLFWTESDGVVQCKSRIKLPNPLVNPTWDFIKSEWDKQMAAADNK